jgi:hypothetical protein
MKAGRTMTKAREEFLFFALHFPSGQEINSFLNLFTNFNCNYLSI